MQVYDVVINVNVWREREREERREKRERREKERDFFLEFAGELRT
jgi:hypothetical protein